MSFIISKKNLLKGKKIPLIFIILGFLISCIYSTVLFQKYDKNFIATNGSIKNYLIKGDTQVYFDEANVIIKQLDNNVNLLKLGSEYKVSFLYPRLLAFFFYLTGEEIKEELQNKDNLEIYKANDKDKKILLTQKQKYQNNYNLEIYKTNNKKLLFLFLQSFFYYFCIYFFFKKTKKKISYKILNLLVFFLCFEPTIMQFNSHFLTESIYFGLLILLFSLLVNFNKSYKYHLIIGLIIGVMYLQRSVALYLLFPIIIYYIFYLKRLSIFIKSIFFIIIGQIIILSLLGYSNYQRSEIFYITPKQTKQTMWYYLTDSIVAVANQDDIVYAHKTRKNDAEQWIKENKINLEDERDRLKLYSYYQSYFFKTFKEYPVISLKIVIWKSLQSSILDPGMVYSTIKSDNSINRYWENSLFGFTEKIIYSLIIYSISTLGAISYFNKKEYLIPSLFIMFGLYHIAILGWVGVSRYSVPSIVCISLLFAKGVLYIKMYLEENNFKLPFKKK